MNNEQPVSGNAIPVNSSDASGEDNKSSPKLNHEGDDNFFSWFRSNNPLYLLSVVFMLLGLYLVGSELETGKVSITTVTGFFAVQNFYEIVMIAMALYLLKNHIQSGHGKLLLVFVMVFLGDLTFYQVRISGMHQLAGNITTLVYIALAVVKFYVVIRVLDLKIHLTRVFYVFSAFALIWVGPKLAYYMVDLVGKSSIGFFDGSYFYYSLWLTAGLIHLPLIIENWRNNNLQAYEENACLGNATTFWRWLMVFPFIVMPAQLFVNAMSDSYGFMDASLPLVAVIAPWAIGAAFFAQSLWRRQCQDLIGLNLFDSVVMILMGGVTMYYASATTVPAVLNHILLIAGLVITWLTRANRINGMGLGFVTFWYCGLQIKAVTTSAIEYGTGLSRTVWAGILMAGSFVLLGLGFLLSIDRKDKQVDDHNSN